MKFATQRAATVLPPKPDPAPAELPVQRWSLAFETRGLECRTVYTNAAGVEVATPWRVRDHGMFSTARELQLRWTREGLLGGFGRIPRR